MKIAFVLDDTLDSSDGVQQYVLLVSDWLRNRGHEVHYITGKTTRTDITNIHSMSKNIRVRFNRNQLSIPLPVRTREIDRLLQAHSFDVIHVQMPFSPFLGSKVVRRASVDSVVVATYHIAPYSWFVVLANKLLGLVQKTTYKHINTVLSVSTVAQIFARQTTGLSSLVIPNAIDTKVWKPKTHKVRDIDITFVGRLVERKGCIFLLQALSMLKAQNKIVDKSVVIAGDGPDRHALESFASENGLMDIVRFVGYVSETEKKDLLQSTKLAVFPSTGGESFGIVLLEAMAAGAVVIAGNNPGYTSVIGAAKGSLVSPYDTKQFATTINALLDDTPKRRQLGQTQQQLLSRYDINTVGSDILAVYQHVISKRGKQLDVKGR